MARLQAATPDPSAVRDTLIALCVTAAVTLLFACLSAFLGGIFGMSLAEAFLLMGLPGAAMMTATLLCVPRAGAAGRDLLVDAAGCVSTLAAICTAAGMGGALPVESGFNLTFAIVGAGGACSFLLGLVMRKEGPAPPMIFFSIYAMQSILFSLAF